MKNWLHDRSKKRGGVVGDIVTGTGGLIVSVVVVLIIVSTLLGANLLGSGTTYNQSAYDMVGNFTEGLGNVSAKIPTILLIAAVVLLFGVIVLLVMRARNMGVGGGSASL